MLRAEAAASPATNNLFVTNPSEKAPHRMINKYGVPPRRAYGWGEVSMERIRVESPRRAGGGKGEKGNLMANATGRATARRGGPLVSGFGRQMSGALERLPEGRNERVPRGPKTGGCGPWNETGLKQAPCLREPHNRLDSKTTYETDLRNAP